MKDFLKTLELEIRLEPDKFEQMSALAFIAQFCRSTISPTELEIASNLTHNILKLLYGPCNQGILKHFIKFLDENDTRSSITFHDHRLKIYVQDKWLFQVILLTSLKSNRDLFLSYRNPDISNDCEGFMQPIFIYILKYIDSNRAYSVYLLQVLYLILKTYSKNLHPILKVDLLKLTNKVSTSQINNFRYYCRNISKLVLLSLTQTQLNQLFSLTLLPIRGIETSDLVEYSNKKVINSIENTVEKILRMFQNNIENRDAGFLYESIVKNFSLFSDWKLIVWPLFAQNLEHIEHESEFFHSFLKYWIPQNVSTYKTEFYNFVSDKPIDTYLKAHILLELRRKGYYDKDLLNIHVKEYFSKQKTSAIALKICTTFHKRTMYPDALELGLVKNYLYSVLEEYLEFEHIKAFEQFFSQIFICSHHICIQNDASLNFLLILYTEFLSDILNYSCTILKTPCFEVAAQIIDIFWNIATGSSKYLKLSYKLEEKFSYEMGENCFYLLLKKENLFNTLKNQKFVENIKCSFEKSEGSCPYLTNLILHRYITEVDIFEMDITLINIIEMFSEKMSLKSTDGVKNYARIYFAKMFNDKKLQFQNDLLEIINKNLEQCCQTNMLCDIRLIFKSVLMLEAILVLVNHDIISEELYRVVQKCMDLVEHILEKEMLQRISEQKYFKANKTYSVSKIQKIIESFINNVLRCLLQIKTIWHNLNKPLILQQLCKIIRISNMKKPVTLSAEVLKHFGSIMEINNNDKNLKISFLNEILNSISDASEEQHLKIRRSPECRLVIHAMCVSENRPQKNLLTWGINNLINILCDQDSSSSAISSALHCLEYLISDTNFHTTTIPFIPKIILKCVELFETPSWIVRNADLQLIKAIIDRFYGVVISESNRPKSIEDLFHLFPELCVPFYTILSLTSPLTNSAVIVLQFFAVSQIKKQPFTFDFIEVTRDCFLSIFTKIISTDASHIGQCAVNAYVALCFEENIPEIFCDTVDFLVYNLKHIRKRNVFRNFVRLLEKLYEKYRTSFECYLNPKHSKHIQKSLIKFFEVSCFLNPVQLDFLLLKNKPQNQVFKELRLVANNDFKSRIWQHNYLANNILNCTSQNIEIALKKLLSVEILDCMKVKILSVIVDGFSKNEFDAEICNGVANTLVNDMIKIGDEKNYVLNCYFNVIFLFLEYLDPESHVVGGVRNSYNQVKNVYKIMTYLAVISKFKHKNKTDLDFIQRIKYFYVSMDLDNEENAEDVSLILKSLYSCVSCPYDRYRVFKIAIHLLLTHGIFDFIVFVTNSKINTVLDALCKVLDFKFLSECIRNERLVKKLIVDSYNLVVFSNGDTVKDECLTFYTKEVDVFIPQYFLQKILEKFVKDSINLKQYFCLFLIISYHYSLLYHLLYRVIQVEWPIR